MVGIQISIDHQLSSNVALKRGKSEDILAIVLYDILDSSVAEVANAIKKDDFFMGFQNYSTLTAVP